MTVNEAKPRALACLKHGVTMIAAMAEVTGCHHQTMAKAVRQLQQERRVVAKVTRTGTRYALKEDEAEEQFVTLAGSRGHLTESPPIDQTTYGPAEEAAYAAVHARGHARTPQVAQDTGLAYRDALGALWRLVAKGTLTVREREGEHDIFSTAKGKR